MNGGEAMGFVFNAGMIEAKEIASSLVQRLNLGERAWLSSTVEIEEQPQRASDTGVIVTVGGDGTILRVVHAVAPLGIPLIGVNLGRIGFMTEFQADEAREGIARLLEGGGRVEERAMLQAEITPLEREADAALPCYPALNDIVVGRGVVSRLVRVRASVDGELLATYNADAVIVSTATGSTGYNMAAGGPILPPSSQDIIVKPVAPHLSLEAAVVLPGTSTIELTAESDTQCVASVDGQRDVALAPGASVQISRSPHMARFLRVHPPTYYYATLIQRLGLVWGRQGYRSSG